MLDAISIATCVQRSAILCMASEQTADDSPLTRFSPFACCCWASDERCVSSSGQLEGCLRGCSLLHLQRSRLTDGWCGCGCGRMVKWAQGLLAHSRRPCFFLLFFLFSFVLFLPQSPLPAIPMRNHLSVR